MHDKKKNQSTSVMLVTYVPTHLACNCCPSLGSISLCVSAETEEMEGEHTHHELLIIQ